MRLHCCHKIPILNLLWNSCVLAFLFLLITGCQEKLTYDYLMEHPIFLGQEAIRCQSIAKIPACKIVFNAVTDFISMSNSQRQHPEQFGESIMQAEIAGEKTKENIAAIKRHMISNQSSDLLKKAEEANNLAQKRIRVLLAIINAGRISE